MSAAMSVHTPLMEREVCTGCGHFHRHVIAYKCECCRTDAQAGGDA